MNREPTQAEIVSAYNALDLPLGSALDKIMEEWRFLAGKLHPDQAKSEKDKARSEAKLKRLNNAKDVLSAHFKGAAHKSTGQCTCNSAEKMNGTNNNHDQQKQEQEQKEKTSPPEHATKDPRGNPKVLIAGCGLIAFVCAIVVHQYNDWMSLVDRDYNHGNHPRSIESPAPGNVNGNLDDSSNPAVDQHLLKYKSLKDFKTQKPTQAEIDAKKTEQARLEKQEHKRQQDIYCQKLAVARYEREINQFTGEIAQYEMKLADPNCTEAQSRIATGMLKLRRPALAQSQANLKLARETLAHLETSLPAASASADTIPSIPANSHTQ